ncbi:hypothetical protein [Rhodococcus sp. P1Y]|uniref:hypothetical protein n=1 Tax=Rhodococcus sp. P1Y TaxID=1302308 RepID=UPI000EB30AE8|nr:hypothetical protein [Rhodococcus sp. P1Y]AYJ51052.1 hypothetical protein D8W71_25275 [Rhodococcus sp. P1Y]
MSENNADPEDTGQISVAELLARNGQKGTNLSTGGRRRRGVKGGISVAELTGEIPIVRAEPASDEAPVIAAAPTPRARSKAEPEPELLSGSTTAAGDLLNQAHDENERRPYGSTASQRPSDSQRPTPASRPAPVSGRRAAPERASEEDAQTVVTPPPARVQRTSGFVARTRAQPTESDAEPKTDVTAPTPAPAATPKPAPSTSAGAPSSTVAAPRIDRGTVGKGTVAAPKVDEAAVDGDADTVLTPDLTKKITALEKSETGDEAKAAEPEEKASEKKAAEEAAPTEPRASGKKGAARQWLGLVGQGVVAVVVGALLFKGFERLWDMLPWVALILSVLVIVGLVAVVRILRRTDDMISMVIAIAVGVFVTLGPLAFQLSTG